LFSEGGKGRFREDLGRGSVDSFRGSLEREGFGLRVEGSGFHHGNDASAVAPEPTAIGADSFVRASPPPT